MQPVSGMTGFGRAEGRSGDTVWVWEARSVNGRNLDVKLRTPPGMESLDALSRSEAARRFRRGSVQLGLSVKRDGSADGPMLRVNTELVDYLVSAGAAYVAQGLAAPARWDGLLQVRGVVETVDIEDDPDARAERDADIARGLCAALDALRAARLSEGETLRSLLTGLVDRIAALADAAEAAAGGQAVAIKERLHKRAAELLGDLPHDPQRLEQEAAALAMKADVREELDRLRGHVADARKLLAAGGELGRKLEFLAQEFHREANTLTSKSATLDLTRIGLDLKTAVDQIKEQSANVE